LKGEDQNAWYHEWEKLKLDLVSLLLGWPFPVRVSLLDPRGNKKRVLCRKGHVGGRVVVEDDKIDQLDITQVRVLLKDAGYIQPLSWDSWQSLSASTSGITVRSAVTLDPVPTKQVQFISLGILPLRAGSRASLLYETINTVFAQSHFGLEEDEIPRDEAKQGQRTSNQRFKDSPTSKQFKRSRRAVDRWPMFFVQILINKQDRGSYHTSIEGLEKEETLTAISNILRAMFKAFLEQHYLQPRREISKLQRLDSMKATAVGDHSQSKLSTPISKQLPHR
jgi:DNA mismatch repair protein MLH3